MRTFLRASAAMAAAGLFLAPAAGAASAATAAPPAPAAGAHITGGATTVTTDSGLPSLLFLKGVTILATAPATGTLTGGSRLFAGLPAGRDHSTGSAPALRFVFPVSGGRAVLAPVSGQVSQRGGVLFVRASSDRTVLFSSFVMDLGRRDVTAAVDGNPRVRVVLFRLDLSHARFRRAGHTVGVTGIGLTVAGAGARALDSGLRTTVLSPGTQAGTAAAVLRS
jgi:hypothetical protein